MGFNWSPMGYHNPCSRDRQKAKFAISGGNPDGNGGGILFWAYDEQEANEAVETYKREGYRNVRQNPVGINKESK